MLLIVAATSYIHLFLKNIFWRCPICIEKNEQHAYKFMTSFFKEIYKLKKINKAKYVNVDCSRTKSADQVGKSESETLKEELDQVKDPIIENLEGWQCKSVYCRATEEVRWRGCRRENGGLMKGKSLEIGGERWGWGRHHWWKWPEDIGARSRGWEWDWVCSWGDLLTGGY